MGNITEKKKKMASPSKGQSNERRTRRTRLMRSAMTAGGYELIAEWGEWPRCFPGVAHNVKNERVGAMPRNTTGSEDFNGCFSLLFLKFEFGRQS